MTSDLASGPAIRDIPRTLYLDTQFLFAYMVPTDEDYEAASAFVVDLRELVESKLVTCLVSIVVLDELAWALSGPLWLRDHGGKTERAAGRREAFPRVRERVAEALADLLGEGWIEFVGEDADCGTMYPDVLARHSLSPADCAHLTIALASGIEAIVTNDRHFHELEDCPLEVIGY
jgi:predicted nucleic acid-binding protein